MKKERYDEMSDDLRPEYDLSQLLVRGVRGKYARRFRAESVNLPSDTMDDERVGGLDRDEWQTRLIELESRYGYTDGFKLLYCPWSTLFEGCEVAFLSMNPGARTPDGADLRTVSDERGNSYVIERDTTRSALTGQYLQLCELMRVSPDRVLCGVLAPYRTKEWNRLRDHQNLAIGRTFWKAAFRVQSSLKVLVCSGKPVADVLIEILGGKLAKSVAARWGNIQIRKYQLADSRCSLVALPHLSRFKLLSRTASRGQIASVLDEWAIVEDGNVPTPVRAEDRQMS